MRHRHGLRKLNRTSSHRLAMLRNMTNSLFIHEAIRTTLPKAKELRRVAEPLITLAKDATVANRRLTFDRQPANGANGTLGVYASTFRQRLTVRTGAPILSDKRPLLRGTKEYVQVSRMGNPLVNELIIPIGKKDFWNATDPEDEAQFVPFYQSLAVASALQLVSTVPVPKTPRDDVVRALLKYSDDDPSFSELLRLDTTVPPTAVASIKRLGPFAHDAAGTPTPDNAGWPNGRRPNDDVTDEVVRVAGGANYIANFVGDGVGVQEKGITPDFPFLPTPYDGRNRRHRDPGE